jgi:hypothetical protein
MLSSRKGGYNQRASIDHDGETIEDKMRIFEDEIIKRIKIIQNFVKNMDGKVKQLKN